MKIGVLAELAKNIVGLEGSSEYDPSKHDGTLRKLLDVSRIKNLGWQARAGLEEKIQKTYASYTSQTRRDV